MFFKTSNTVPNSNRNIKMSIKQGFWWKKSARITYLRVWRLVIRERDTVHYPVLFSSWINQPTYGLDTFSTWSIFEMSSTDSTFINSFSSSVPLMLFLLENLIVRLYNLNRLRFDWFVYFSLQFTWFTPKVISCN